MKAIKLWALIRIILREAAKIHYHISDFCFIFSESHVCCCHLCICYYRLDVWTRSLSLSGLGGALT